MPFVRRLGKYLYSDYRNARHPQGILRGTTIEEYTKPQSSWDTLLDLDALSTDEMRNLNLAWTEVRPDGERGRWSSSSAAGSPKLAAVSAESASS